MGQDGAKNIWGPGSLLLFSALYLFSDSFSCVNKFAQENSIHPKVFTVNRISLQDLPELEDVDVKDPLFIRSLNSSHSKVRLLARHVSQLSDIQLNSKKT